MVESAVKYTMTADHYMIYQHEEARRLKEEEAQKRKDQAKERKAVAQKKEALKAVFGPTYKEVKEGDPLKGIVLPPRDIESIAQPKDKWKLGNELKQLKKAFPHDRVLERMIDEEFKTNQVFKYPQEYDLYDAEKEEAFKKGFKNGQEKEARAWAVSTDHAFIEKQAEQLENFKKADMYDKDGYAHYMKAQAKKEMALEKLLHQQAYDYQDYVKNRGKGKEKKTLRAVLAQNYQSMVAKHGKLAEERFPHTAYG